MATTVLRSFEIYQKSRVQFVQTVAELAKRRENFEALQSAGNFPAHKNTYFMAIMAYKYL